MKVLFLDTVHPILSEKLARHGYECRYDYHMSYEKLIEEIAPYYGLVVRSRLPIDGRLINAATNLRWVARSGSGLENIDLAAAKKRGIEVYSSPEGNSTAVGEHALGMLLMLFNKLHIAHSQVRAGIWNREENRGLELSGRTIGIIGYGHMGSSFAEKLKGFNCRILAYDKYKSGYGNDYVQEVERSTLIREAEVLSIHLPLSAETRHYIDASFIAEMGRPFYLINTARGQHVDTAALLEGLHDKKVLGACLDVLEYEKRSLEGLNEASAAALTELRKRENVIFSPHVAGWTQESYFKLSNVLADKILANEPNRQ